MTTTLAIMIGIFALLAGAMVAHRPQRTRKDVVIDALAAAGVAVGRADRSARVTRHGVPLKVWVVTERRDPVGLEISVDTAPLATPLTLTPVGLVTAMAKLVGGHDVVVGDPRFDRRVRVGCHDPAHVLAVLDPGCRIAIVHAIGLGATFDAGAWRVWHPVGGRPSGEAIERTLGAVARAHRAMRNALVVPVLEALQRRVRHDPAPGVRQAALTLLLRRRLDSPSLLTAAVQDPHPAVKLVAAQALGADGHPHLWELVRSGGRTWRFAAAVALAHREPPGAATTPRVVEVLAEAVLDRDHACNAADALAAIATPAAARALRQAAVLHGPSRRAARRALNRLRARLDGAGAGAVSMAARTGGGLSEVPASGRGDVSES